jgi:hypothetical protein
MRLLSVSTISTAAAIALFALPAFAGPVRDFENAFRTTYASYRVSLFKTNAKDQQASSQALSAFQQKWQAMMNDWKASPPPQYADDPEWADTVSAVDSLLAKAGSEVAEGKMEEAHETLEGVRDLFWDLHKRNNIVTFSDRMNAYHLEMEHALALDPATIEPAIMRERAVRLDYLAAEVLANPPTDAAGNAEYETLSKDFSSSVAAFLDATRSGDAAAIKTAFGALKPAYSKFFLKFG